MIMITILNALILCSKYKGNREVWQSDRWLDTWELFVELREISLPVSLSLGICFKLEMGGLDLQKAAAIAVECFPSSPGKLLKVWARRMLMCRVRCILKVKEKAAFKYETPNECDWGSC